MNKIFLIYGHLDDMFISRNLQKNNFRPFLNGYLKSIGYDQVVFYSGAKNVGKFVLDDESALLAINKNKKQQAATANNASPMPEQPKKKRRIMNPRAAASATPEPVNDVSNVQPTEQVQSTGESADTTNTKLVYKQPKITSV